MRSKTFDPEEIADAAMMVFWQHGYAATSIQDLVEGTGLSRSSLYSTFENKQALYQGALRRYWAVTTENVQLLAGPGQAKDLIRQLLMRVVEDEMGDSRRKGCFMANATLEMAGHDDAIAELVTQNFQRLLRALEKLIKRGQESGDISSMKSARALARFLLNTMQGLRVLGKGSAPSQRRQSLQDVVDVALDCL